MRRVLVVEDNQLTANLLKRTLEREGYDVLHRTSGRAALELVSEESIDIAVLDYRLPDIAGVDVPNDMQGRSFVPILKGNTPNDWRKTFYYHYYENPGAHNVARHYGVTDGRHKLIRYYALEGKSIDDWELFDREKDPNELTNVYGSTDLVQVQTRLTKELDRLRQVYKVPADDNPGRAPRPKKKAVKNKKKKAS